MKEESYYILEGKTVKAVNAEEWARWFEDNYKERIVARDNLGFAQVSTVFLGLHFSVCCHEQPKLFETMVFGGPLDQEMERYSTWEEAEKGHAEMIKRVKKAANQQ
jgi:hypothetical protein